ncbi:MAG: M28 family peptidase [Kofleriaceae bacterium]|nr:M28 family peptidase [Kofleriaceae bacterium]
MRRTLLAVMALLGCSDDAKPIPPTDPQDLQTTLDALAAFGEKQPGTEAGRMAAAYIESRFEMLGLEDVHQETFQIPRWQLNNKALSISIDGVMSTPGFDVFEAAGSGVADGPIVDVASATDADLEGLDLTGKIALVKRETSFHRSAQLRNVAAKGATAMLYLSVAPENLRQVGSVRFGWNANEPIPAITIGADDGAMIKAALDAQKTVTAHIAVDATSVPANGINIVGKITGERPETIVLGAHYDTWATGSSDNGSGVAELLAVAARRVQHEKPRYTLVFVAYDGEETGLYGGYDYYRKHTVVAADPIIAVINFESPSAKNPDLAGLAHSNQPKLDEALQLAHLRQIYGVYAGLEIVAQLFGGIIPTDIQGVYRGGTPTVTTAVTNPYYHTVKDTPDKVDLDLLVASSDAFDAAIDHLGKLSPADFGVPDPSLWTADVATQVGATVDVDVTVRDGSGAPQADANVEIAALHDDFMLTAEVKGKTDASGHVKLSLPADAATAGAGNRFVHVSAGPTYPLVEKIVALP